ncbi:Ankyrin repeat family protein [Prunus dulcis]|uniref:Ankyrin repeat family protein n=1 Tax=Prunus dulcis TaxID=3755 RepID=A0A4Y1RB15_PRUDU|nr:Ankyrin repeat family protein [Prunus dulcis]
MWRFIQKVPKGLECQFGVLYALPQVPPRILDSLQAPPSESQVSRGVGYPALRQAPYAALVVPAYGEIVRYCVEVARGVGYPTCRQTPYVALVVPAYGEICDMMCRSRVEILGNVQFIGETLPKFRQKVSVFSKWARHRGDVRNSKGFATGFGKNSGRVLSQLP